MIALTFDIEPDIHSNEYLGIKKGIPRILSILNKHNIKATFFTTCDCIKKYPQIFQKLKKENHEIALHGYIHERFDTLSYAEKEEKIKNSIKCFKKYLKILPSGFRAPQHSIDNETLNLLEKYNFAYDSSYSPFNILQILFFPIKKQSYIHFFSPINKYKKGNLTEIPTSSFFMPFVSLVFRAFPQFLISFYFFILNLFSKNQVFYAHSWDFIDVQGRIAKAFPKEKLISNFESFLEKNKNTKYCLMRDLI